MSGDSGPVVPLRLQKISWLLGTWESVKANGEFPSINSFEYNEVLVFSLVGAQPLMEYSGSSTHPITGNPMHRESGWLRIRGESDLSFMVAHNFGLSTIEEGQVEGTSITLKASNIGRMSPDSMKQTPAVKVTQLERIFSLDTGTDELMQEVSMATDKTPTLTHHLRAVYRRKIE